MWREDIKTIREELSKYHMALNGRASEKEIEELEQNVRTEFHRELPKAFEEVLRVVNGFDNNGLIIYGDTPDDENTDFVSQNRIWLEKDDDHSLYLAQGEDNWLVYDEDTKKYRIITLPAGTELQSSDSLDEVLDQMISEVV